MNNIFNKFLIIAAIAVILGGVYSYMSNDLVVSMDRQTAAAADSSLTSSSNNDMTSALGSNDQISQDTAFLVTLTSLTKIKIDTSIFDSTPFNLLNDNTVILEPTVAGRPNPFAPVSSTTLSSAPVSPVTTNVPTQITTKSVVLNGAIASNSMGVTSTYFEYGPTPSFGKTTAPAKQSLIGTFVTSVSSLTSDTTYFYRAVAKIGGNTHFGETVSFTTN